MTTAETEKRDRRIANRRLRRTVRVRLAAEPDGVLPALREVGPVWCFGKDGTQRFDPDRWPQGMRKQPAASMAPRPPPVPTHRLY